MVIDLTKQEVASRILLGESPKGVSISPDGHWVVAAIELTNSVAFIDTATHTSTFRSRPPVKIRACRVQPDRRWLLVNAEEAARVDVIDVGGASWGVVIH